MLVPTPKAESTWKPLVNRKEDSKINTHPHCTISVRSMRRYCACSVEHAMLPRPTATTYMETLNTQARRSPDNLILRLVTFKSTVMVQATSLRGLGRSIMVGLLEALADGSRVPLRKAWLVTLWRRWHHLAGSFAHVSSHSLWQPRLRLSKAVW